MAQRRLWNVESLEGRNLLSGLSVSLATDQPVYQVGQPVQISLVETNNTNQPITVDEGPSIDGFIVKQAGASIWRSNAGINPLFVVANTLQPGQSFTLKTTWDGIPNGASQAVTGTFEVYNQLILNVAPATFEITDPSSSANPDPSPSPPTLTSTPTPTPTPSPTPTAPITNPVTTIPIAPAPTPPCRFP